VNNTWQDGGREAFLNFYFLLLDDEVTTLFSITILKERTIIGLNTRSVDIIFPCLQMHFIATKILSVLKVR